ncbi:hypothetical protein HBI27_152460 [Parastagonospora nodorum]|nr:hypothetical protein HBI27_152460 [Parastagonospora nodorum]
MIPQALFKNIRPQDLLSSHRIGEYDGHHDHDEQHGSRSPAPRLVSAQTLIPAQLHVPSKRDLQLRVPRTSPSLEIAMGASISTTSTLASHPTLSTSLTLSIYLYMVQSQPLKMVAASKSPVTWWQRLSSKSRPRGPLRS